MVYPSHRVARRDRPHWCYGGQCLATPGTRSWRHVISTPFIIHLSVMKRASARTLRPHSSSSDTIVAHIIAINIHIVSCLYPRRSITWACLGLSFALIIVRLYVAHHNVPYHAIPSDPSFMQGLSFVLGDFGCNFLGNARLILTFPVFNPLPLNQLVTASLNVAQMLSYHQLGSRILSSNCDRSLRV